MHLFPSRLFTFLLTPLREGRHADGDDCTQTPLISTHAPAGGATKPYFLINLIFSLFLLTPLREGRPAAGRDRKKMAEISTHAPAGGATADARSQGGRGLISTHAPAGGATDFALRISRPRPHFYSRPCGRGDAPGSFIVPLSESISTHAPAGGATRSWRARH